MPGFGSVGVWEVILILAVLLLVFGAKRLPEIGAALGKGIREFKGSVREIESEINRPADKPRSELPRREGAEGGGAPGGSGGQAPGQQPAGQQPAGQQPAGQESAGQESAGAD